MQYVNFRAGKHNHFPKTYFGFNRNSLQIQKLFSFSKSHAMLQESIGPTLLCKQLLGRVPGCFLVLPATSKYIQLSASILCQRSAGFITCQDKISNSIFLIPYLLFSHSLISPPSQLPFPFSSQLSCRLFCTT